MTPSTSEPADPPSPATSRLRKFLTSLLGQLGMITVAALAIGAAVLLILDRRVGAPLGEHLKITTGILAVLAGAWAVVISYHRQRSTERELDTKDRELDRADTKDQRDLELATRREYRERFANGVTLLGNPEPTIALAGIYALANLADDWADGAQQCLDILCARLRLPWPKKTDLPPDTDREDETSWWDDGEREIRNTILRTITTHLKEPDPTDKNHQNTKPGRWSPLDIDLTGAHLPDVDFRSAHFFGEASFTGARFTQEALFDSATFPRGAWFRLAWFESTAFFRNATFPDGAWFTEAELTQGVEFVEAEFPRGARFEKTEFHGEVIFTNAKFDRSAVASGANRDGRPFDLEALIREQAKKYPPVEDEEEPVQGE